MVIIAYFPMMMLIAFLLVFLCIESFNMILQFNRFLFTRVYWNF
ncbi:unnamed protein product [Arabidopsis halleri]